jgi:hypothetical protein
MQQSEWRETGHVDKVEADVETDICRDVLSEHNVKLTATLCVCNKGEADAFSYILGTGELACERNCTSEPTDTMDAACAAAQDTHVPWSDPCSSGCVANGSSFELERYPPGSCSSFLTQYCDPAKTDEPIKVQ